MAKGQGAVMAWGEMWGRRRENSIPCPICGQDMEWEDVAWFCRSGELRVTGTHEPCRPPESVIDKFYALPRGCGGYQDCYQFFAEPHNGDPAIHAALFVDGRVLARAQYIRGAGGCTNFTAQPEWGVDPALVVQAFEQGARWTMAPWFDEE